MPYLKSVCIHSTVDRSLNYILDPEKTNGKYITSLNCMADPKAAYDMMKLVYEQHSGKRFDAPIPKEGKARVKAIHYIISFDPKDNVSPSKAMVIGREFVKKMFGMDCQCVIAAHTDTDNMHLHILVNSYDISGKKIYSNWHTLNRAREISDEVCKRYGIEPYKGKGRDGGTVVYNEWQHRKEGTSWKKQIAEKINELIPQVQSVDDLIETLKAQGYEIKRGKYISVKAPGQERYVRTKTLGEDYTEESLATRIRFNYVEGGFSIAQYDTSELYHAYADVTDGIYKLDDSPADELDRMYAILYVLNEKDINSIGEVEGKSQQISKELERLQKEADLVSFGQTKREEIIYHAEQYFKYKDIENPTDYELQMLETFRQSMEKNDIHSETDVDKLRDKHKQYEEYLSQLEGYKQSLLSYRAVYADIQATYAQISKGDYISNIVEQERRRKAVGQQTKEKQKPSTSKKKTRR
ncbi:MAG: relaxase/mobilization nuclease domain-containing protein [Ruminococcus sp.]|nr:relaxase/mobilization nuclease domain-containing protein [Ruminococcus sp.]